jgi:hypothetical protein
MSNSLCVLPHSAARPSLPPVSSFCVSVTKFFLAAFTQELRDLGWTDGHNVRIEFRGGAGNPDRIRMLAKELVDLQPDVILVVGFAAAKAAQQQTSSIPLVFAGVGDPVSGGLVASISRPEGNSTGITNLFPSVAGKWLELLKEVAPGVARVALVFNPELSSGTYFASIEAAAAQYAVTAIRAPVRDAAEIDRAVEAFAAEPNGGLMVLPPPPRRLRCQIGPSAGAAAPAAHDLSDQIGCHSWRLDVLRAGGPHLSAGCIVRRPHLARCEGKRASGSVSDQVRACDQPQDREGPEPHRAA